MQPFTKVHGKVLPLPRADVDTDQIIPAKYLKRIERTGFGDFAFDEWRKDPSFVLNDHGYDGAEILVAGPNFGCGSSREHAPWALQQMGLKVLIAPSFADIFRNNCAKIGLLTVELPQDAVDRLIARAEDSPGWEMEVDLASQTVTLGNGKSRRFEVDPFVKDCLLRGLDEIGLTLEDAAAIDAYEPDRRDFLPATAT
ncbi:MAG TPA: 3-isopropylmalate dehydratase small subunit [Dehalococcoidia bacterium]|nr:3-isopropylmalate dehydratase small subunit [Dehalococcoidia bacterium]